MNIALATDHAGYEQLKSLQTWLESLGHTCHNFGPTSLQPDDDYTDFVKAIRGVPKGHNYGWQRAG
jgi:ribose 5-phosphate isomerase RpiB